MLDVYKAHRSNDLMEMIYLVNKQIPSSPPVFSGAILTYLTKTANLKTTNKKSLKISKG
jgi:hypothetical protein